MCRKGLNSFQDILIIHLADFVAQKIPRRIEHHHRLSKLSKHRIVGRPFASVSKTAPITERIFQPD